MTGHSRSSRATLATLAALGLAAIVTATLTASGPVTWTTATQAEFLKGQSIGVAVDEIGRVFAAPAISVVHDAASPQIWSLAGGPGDTWVAGTGGDGRVIRSRNGQVATLLDTTETNIYAVTTAPDGRVFAASGPDGKVYAIDAAGASKVLFDPAEKYIWALLVDRSGRVWVGAGSPAVIYRIDADGSNKVVYKPSAAHVVSLAIDATGRVLAGTEGPGRVYRFDATDRPTALFESGLAEVRAITVAADGTIFAAALAGESTAAEPTGAAASLGASAAASTPAAPNAPTRKSVIFRMPANGLPEPLWETSDIVYDIATGDAGAVLAATGPDGHLFSIRPNGTDVLINGVDARQVTRLVRNGDRTWLATANP
ncbi:MAG: WD40 repeat domain-containing protein, partial [Acidobacteria bacterium]|nr:WD40 repeat domain-containing protein [Acidobacteriota bacterium]